MLKHRTLAAALALFVVAAFPVAASSHSWDRHGHHPTGGDYYVDPVDGDHYTDPLDGDHYVDSLGGDHYTDPVDGDHGHGHGGEHKQVKGHHSATTGGYARYCRYESKKHRAGQRGTLYSLCVSSMAKLAAGKTSSARKACAVESKRHRRGERGTPFARCVVAGNKLLHDKLSAQRRHRKR
jgi:hypothetical protein